MSSVSKMIAASAACIAITVGALYAFSGEQRADLKASPVNIEKETALLPVPAENTDLAPARAAFVSTPTEEGFSPEITATFDTEIAEPVIEPAQAAATVTLDQGGAAEVDWPTSTDTSMSAYKKVKIDRDVYRSVEKKN